MADLINLTGEATETITSGSGADNETSQSGKDDLSSDRQEPVAEGPFAEDCSVASFNSAPEADLAAARCIFETAILEVENSVSEFGSRTHAALAKLLYVVSYQAAELEKTPLGKSLLIDHLREDSRTASWLDRRSEPRGALELLLVHSLGLEAKSRRSMYATTIRRLQADNVELTEGEYLKAISSAGGVVSLVEAARQVDGHSSGDAGANARSTSHKRREGSTDIPKDKIKKFVTRRLRTGALRTVPLTFDIPDPELDELFVVLFKRRGELADVVYVEVAEKAVAKHVVQALEAEVHCAKNKILKENIDKYLWHVNRGALVSTGIAIDGFVKLRKFELSDFVKATKNLWKLLPNKDNYFVGEPAANYDNGGRLQVYNAEFKEIDPGRYIKNAKPKALIAWDHVNVLDVEGLRKSITAYVGEKCSSGEPPQFV